MMSIFYGDWNCAKDFIQLCYKKSLVMWIKLKCSVVWCSVKTQALSSRYVVNAVNDA